jgi:hypothetical protein
MRKNILFILCLMSIFLISSVSAFGKEYCNGLDDDGDGLIDEYHDTENYGALKYNLSRSWWDQKTCNGIGMCVVGLTYCNSQTHLDMGQIVPNPYYRSDVEENIITCWTNADGAFPNATSIDKCGVDKDYDCGGQCDGGVNDGDTLWYMAMICNFYSWDLQEILQENLEKLKKRYPEGFTHEAAGRNGTMIDWNKQ